MGFVPEFADSSRISSYQMETEYVGQRREEFPRGMVGVESYLDFPWRIFFLSREFRRQPAGGTTLDAFFRHLNDEVFLSARETIRACSPRPNHVEAHPKLQEVASESLERRRCDYWRLDAK